MSPTQIGILVLAVVFLIGGISRIVEFSGIDLTKRQKAIFTSLHILGCVFFSVSMVIAALDTRQSYKTLMTALFFSALAIFFPVHIFVGLKRRIKIRDSQKP